MKLLPLETGNNIQVGIHLSDTSFQKDQAQGCSLGVCINTDYLIFHVLDEQQSKYQVFHKHDYHKSYNDYFLKKAVQKVLDEEELLHLNYKHKGK